jgi:hypothetical protein
MIKKNIYNCFLFFVFCLLVKSSTKEIPNGLSNRTLSLCQVKGPVVLTLVVVLDLLKCQAGDHVPSRSFVLISGDGKQLLPSVNDLRLPFAPRVLKRVGHNGPGWGSVVNAKVDAEEVHCLPKFVGELLIDNKDKKYQFHCIYMSKIVCFFVCFLFLFLVLLFLKKSLSNISDGGCFKLSIIFRQEFQ